MEEMFEGGATPIDFNQGRWYQAGGYRAPSLLDADVVGATRPYIEGHVRRRTAALTNVTIETGLSVTGLAFDGERVRGVRREDRCMATRTLRVELRRRRTDRLRELLRHRCVAAVVRTLRRSPTPGRSRQ